MRFSAIGMAGLASWLLIPKSNTEIAITVPPSESDNVVNNQSRDPVLDILPTEESGIEQLFLEFWTDSTTIEPLLIWITIPIMIVVAGIGLDTVLVRLFRKKHDELIHK